MQNSRRLVKLRSAWLWLVPLAFVLVFFYQPLVAIFRLAFSKAFVQGLAAFKLEQVTRPLGFTVWQALLSTLLTLALGLPSAYLFSHFTFPGRKTLRLLTLLPFILPTVVTAAAFNALLGPRGLLNLGLMALFKLPSAPIHLLNSLPAILLASTFAVGACASSSEVDDLKASGVDVVSTANNHAMDRATGGADETIS